MYCAKCGRYDIAVLRERGCSLAALLGNCSLCVCMVSTLVDVCARVCTPFAVTACCSVLAVSVLPRLLCVVCAAGSSFPLLVEKEEEFYPTAVIHAPPPRTMITRAPKGGFSGGAGARGGRDADTGSHSPTLSPAPNASGSNSNVKSPRARRGSPHGYGTLFSETPKEYLCASTELEHRRIAAMVRCGIDISAWDAAIAADRPLGGNPVSPHDANGASEFTLGAGDFVSDPWGEKPLPAQSPRSGASGSPTTAVKAVQYTSPSPTVDPKLVEKCIADVSVLAGGGDVDLSALEFVLAHGSRSQHQRVLK